MQGRANTVSGHCRVVAVLGQGVTEEQGLVSTHSPTRPLPTSLLPHTQHQHLNAQWKIQYLASHPSTAGPLMGSDFSRFHTKYTKMANIGLHKISQYLFCRWTSLVTRDQIWKRVESSPPLHPAASSWVCSCCEEVETSALLPSP